MYSYPETAQRILDRFKRKKAEIQLVFQPSSEKAALGEFAFADDVLNVILIGVATGVLKDLIVWFVKETAIFVASQVSPKDIEQLCNDVIDRSASLEDGVKKLQQQGISLSQSQTAIELLKEAIRDELKEGTDSASPSELKK